MRGHQRVSAVRGHDFFLARSCEQRSFFCQIRDRVSVSLYMFCLTITILNKDGQEKDTERARIEIKIESAYLLQCLHIGGYGDLVYLGSALCPFTISVLGKVKDRERV